MKVKYITTTVKEYWNGKYRDKVMVIRCEPDNNLTK